MNKDTIFELLKLDHDKVKDLFKKAEESKDRASLKKIFEQIETELSIHSAVEEEYFYNKLYVSDELKELLTEAMAEHENIENQIVDVEDKFLQNAINEEQLAAGIKVLEESVVHHIKEEEGKMFEMVRNALDEEKLIEMAELFSKGKQEEMDSLKS
jgi:hypothetical protein